MIDRDHDLSVLRQAEALGVSRSAVYYKPRPTSAADLQIMRRIDELHLELAPRTCVSRASNSLFSSPNAAISVGHTKVKSLGQKK